MRRESESTEVRLVCVDPVFISMMRMLKLSCICVYGFESVLQPLYRHCKVIVIAVAELASRVKLRCGSAHDGVRSEVYCFIVLLFGKLLFYCSIVYASIVG